MTDRLEHDLSTLFDDRATAIDAPPVPLDRLVRDGEVAAAAHRRRTRAVAVAAVAAAVLLAATIPWALRGEDETTPNPADVPTVTNTSDERPASIEDLPTGAPPVVPYIVDDTLHFQGEEYDVPPEAGPFGMQGDMFLSAGDTLLLMDDEPAPESENQTVRLFLAQDGEVVPFREVTAALSGFQETLILSADGSMLLVVSKADEGAARVTAYAVPSGEELGHTNVKRPPGTFDADAGGRVYWVLGDPTFVWTPGRDPQRLDLPVFILAVTASGVLVDGGDGLEHGTISAGGDFVQQGSVDEPRDDEGRIYVMDDSLLQFGGGFSDAPDTFTDVLTGKTTDVLLPGNARSSVLAIEGNRNVILFLAQGDTRGFLRCSLVSGACDRILSNLPEGTRLTFSNSDAARGTE